MSKYRKPLAVAAVAAMAATTLAACGSGGSSGGGADANTLYYLTGPRLVEHLDPQRMYVGRDISNMGRLTYRSLVTNPVTTDAKVSTTLVPDLATDTGTSSQGGKVWQFTLKDGVKWQDGKPVTCEDLKYGLSRGFATDVITGGPNYILGYLDVPKDKDGSPAYKGPYTKVGQADYDKAVTCDGNTITYRFNKPWPDFPLSVASLRYADPYRADQDHGAKSEFSVFSDGPYKLQGTWDKSNGGTFVKNKEWDASTDSVRKQNVDKIVFKQGIADEILTQRFISDSGNDKKAVTDRRIPPSFFSQITGDVAKRATLNPSPYTDYLMPNFKTLTNPKVREALMLSTDTKGWITAGGGPKAYAPSQSIVAPTLIGAQPNPAFKDIGDFAKAKQVLKSAGVKMPYPIKFTYSGGTPTSDKQAAALQSGWQKAGFKVTLDPLTDTYYEVIQKPTNDSDVVWAGWGADWPTIATVIPPLFDSRLNLSKDSNGQDYGNYKSDQVNKLIDKAAQQSSVEAAAKIYGQIDQILGNDVAYIPLEITQFYILHGSEVTTYVQNPATSMYPDLGDVAVKH
jgi:peptide/nickel transport system substrate-binding protein